MIHRLPAKLIRLSLALALLAGVVWATPALIARAATITVTTTQDENNSDGDCSLREAIISANTDTSVDQCTRGNGADTVVLLASTYTLSVAGQNENAAATGDLDITADLTLTGAGKNDTFIDGAGLDRIFEILDGAVVQMAGVTIENGDAGTGDGGRVRVDASVFTLTDSRIRNSVGESGGGIRIEDEGVATIVNSRLSNNTAISGGGLYVGDFPGSASALVINSLVEGNSVSGSAAGSSGGGLRSASGGLLTVVNSTISGNSAELHGGGIHADNAVSLYNVTITSNTADSDGDDSGNGGGISLAGGTITATNTLLGGNTDSSPTGNQLNQCSGTLTSGGYNLISTVAGCTITGNTAGNIIGQFAQLGALKDNGGPTHTHDLLPASPAIDAGAFGGCRDHTGALLTTDQRGYARPIDGDNSRGPRCDIGASEFASPGAPTPTPTPTATPSATPTVPPACAAQCVFLPLITKE